METQSYVIADYERSNFTVAQCLFKDPNPQNITPIYPPSAPTPSPLPSPPPTITHHSGLSKTTLIAIIVVIIVVLLLLLAISFILFQVRKKRKAREEEEQRLADAHNNAVLEEIRRKEHQEVLEREAMRSILKPMEIDGVERERLEMQATEMRHELEGKERAAELPVKGWRREEEE